jgi:hypothetical protein
MRPPSARLLNLDCAVDGTLLTANADFLKLMGYWLDEIVNSMDQTTQQNAAMVEESSAAAATLASEGRKLKAMMAQFDLVNGMSRGASARGTISMAA